MTSLIRAGRREPDNPAPLLLSRPGKRRHTGRSCGNAKKYQGDIWPSHPPRYVFEMRFDSFASGDFTHTGHLLLLEPTAFRGTHHKTPPAQVVRSAARGCLRGSTEP